MKRNMDLVSLVLFNSHPLSSSLLAFFLPFIFSFLFTLGVEIASVLSDLA